MNKIRERSQKTRRPSPAVQAVAIIAAVAALLGVGYLQMNHEFKTLVNSRTGLESMRTGLAATHIGSTGKFAANEYLTPGVSTALLRSDGTSLNNGAPPEWSRWLISSEGNLASGPRSKMIDAQGRNASLWSALLGGTHSMLSISAKQDFGAGKTGYLVTSIDITPAIHAFRRSALARIGLSIASLLFCLLVVLTCGPEILARRTARAETDPVTGLPNYHAFHSRMVEEVERCNRYERPISLLMIEIDYLMTLVDTQGPVLADKVLAEISEVLRGSFRMVDILSYRGDAQFVALLPETNLRGALTAAERLRTRIEKYPFKAPHGAKLRLTASIGMVAAASSSTGDVDNLIINAERALTDAKHAGRNQVSAFGAPVAA